MSHMFFSYVVCGWNPLKVLSYLPKYPASTAFEVRQSGCPSPYQINWNLLVYDWVIVQMRVWWNGEPYVFLLCDLGLEAPQGTYLAIC